VAALIVRLDDAAVAAPNMQGLIDRGAYTWPVQSHLVQAQYVKASQLNELLLHVACWALW
jgi:hypothetical protein